LLGVIVAGLGLLGLVSMMTAGRGWITGAWLNLFRAGFGWGSFVIPLALLAGGVWLVLRSYAGRIPRPEVEQVVGALLLYLVLLAGLHGLLEADGWPEMLALARQGKGGGLVGAALLHSLLASVGGTGALIALLAFLLAGLILASGLSVPELFGWIGRVLRWVRYRVAPPRPARPQRMWSTSSRLAPMEPTGRGDVVGERAVGGGPVSEEVFPRIRLGVEAVIPHVWALPALEETLEPGAVGQADDEFDRERATLIEETLGAFGAPARVVEVHRGPTITQFGVEPDFIEGRGGRRMKVKVSKISALADDLALALAAPSIRIEAPVPGKGYVGIEVPNPVISLVSLRDVMASDKFHKIGSRLRLALGQDVSGHAVAGDLASMPHLLIAGTTGSGKSVCVNAIISCLLLQNTPDELKFVMVDPKRVELTFYNGIPHLLAPVVVDLERVVPALQWVSREMDERYRRFAREGARNIDDYNQRLAQVGQKPIPYLVIVIDELADLMMLAPDETERVITRLAQLARATGIHLVIATQRPSVDVVTGLIKANFPARIAFAVASSVDSRVILDQPGAERLLGRGDMLFQAPDAAAPVRMQGAFVSERELNRLILHWRAALVDVPSPQDQAAGPVETIPLGAPLKQAPLWEGLDTTEDEEGDELFNEAVAIVREMRRASISLLQRRLRIGYTRAARLMDDLEDKGIVGPAQQGSQAREVLDYGELAPASED
jgi:S-DNA-T family DNA segregation ATPase FtsK/SpoIIIE